MTPLKLPREMRTLRDKEKGEKRRRKSWCDWEKDSRELYS